MFSRAAAFVAAAAVLIPISGCLTSGAPQATVSIIDAVPESTSATFLVHGKSSAAATVAALQVETLRIPAGKLSATPVVNFEHGRGETLTKITMTAFAGASYTVVVLGERWRKPSLRVKVFVDDPDPHAGSAYGKVDDSKPTVRFIDACPDGANVDVLANQVDVFQNVGFADESRSLPFNSGSYTWAVWPASQGVREIATPISLTLNPRHHYTILYAGRASDHSAHIVVFAR